MNTMYIAYVKHNIMPSDFLRQPPSVRRLISVFNAKEYEDEQEALKKAKR